ncbi:MAG: gamma-glutamyl-gamma-aminobutyrate hydrolase family protein [Gammaproteobacteria bacterium]|nr:gamma-glutamyl-gamma-aminobutyrate hydrolase family protein [Gammaproteobacteria bacterium]
MRRLLVLQHVPSEPLGVLDPLLRAAGLRIRYVNFARHPAAQVEIARYAGLVVLGGPMNVDQSDRHPHLLHEIEVIRAALDRGIPILGICLGAQLLAAALGARVHPNPVREIGWYPLAASGAAEGDPLFRHLHDQSPVFQWHAYTFTEPAGSIHLASTESCRNQAFRYGDCAYGLQFHLEVDRPLIQRWLRQSGMQHELDALGGEAHARRVEEQTTAHLERSQAMATALFGSFIERIGWKRPHPPLRSR